jgi:hypothetical protein
MASSGMLRRVALVRTDVSEEIGASIIRVTRIGELGTLVLTSLHWSPMIPLKSAKNTGAGLKFAFFKHTKQNSVVLSPQANYTD